LSGNLYRHAAMPTLDHDPPHRRIFVFLWEASHAEREKHKSILSLPYFPAIPNYFEIRACISKNLG
jgi:hypothetical protein